MPVSRKSFWQPALLPFWLLVLLPLAAGLCYALLYSFGLAGLLAEGFILRHWGETFTRREVWASLLHSLRIAATVVLFSAAAALWLARRLRSRLDGAFPAAWLYLPLVTPGLVAAFAAFQLLSGSGLLARVLAAAGLIAGPAEMPELVLDPWAWGVVITHCFLAIPFLVMLFHQLYKSERVEEYRRLASSLGATARQNLWRVEIPLLIRAAAGNLALLLVLVLGSYEVPLLLGRQSPQMLSVLIVRHFSMFDLGQKPVAYALALLYTLVVVLALGLTWRRQAPDET